MIDRKQTAQAALDAHDALRASHDREPAIDPETDLPYDTHAWLRWREQDNEPAYKAWGEAMDALIAAGYDVEPFEGKPSRHPWSFRPWCRAVLGQELTDADHYVPKEEQE